MLGGVLIHTVLFGLGLRVFLHAVHLGIGDHAGNRYFMTYMIAELEGVAVELPSAAFCRSKLVLIGRVARLKAARERPRFLMGSFGLCRSQSGRARKHEQRKKYYRDLNFHPLPPRVRNEKRKSRPGTRLVNCGFIGIGGPGCSLAV